MNKKIKIIDVFNKIANGKIPKAIVYQNIVYRYIKNEFGEGYLHKNFDNETGYEDIDWLVDDIHWDSTEDLNKEVEILEDNTEEIEELKMNEASLRNTVNKINELVRAVNELRKGKTNE